MHDRPEPSTNARVETARESTPPAAATARRSVPPRPSFDALTYDVALDDQRRLFLRAAIEPTLCHRALYRRDQPCEQCPALQAIASHRAAEAAWRVSKDAIHLVRAYPISAGTARCDRVVLGTRSVEAVRRAHVESHISDSQLSPRERQVLDHLRLGCSIEDVATTLGISLHTVKFHTGRLLVKLGAESRHDLLRVLG